MTGQVHVDVAFASLPFLLQRRDHLDSVVDQAQCGRFRIAPAPFGMAVVKWSAKRDLLRVMARPRLDGRAGRALRFLGRNSPLCYLLHQPVLFALFRTWLRLADR